MARRKPGKLTLAVDPVVVRRAKSYAANHHTSVSSLVESYLKHLTEAEAEEHSDDRDDFPPITSKLYGAIRIPDGKDTDQLKWEYLSEKYLRD